MPGVPGKAFLYEVVHALLIVKDKASQEESGIKWNGFGRLVEKLGPSGSTALPVLLGRGSGTYPISITWQIPTGFASPKCGRLYDQFAGGTELSTTVGGEVGDRHLTLTIAEKKTETSKSGTTQQTITANGKVVLDLK